MKQCPWCEGRKTVGQLAYGEVPDAIRVGNVTIPIMGTMLEVGCKVCRGQGEVPDDFNFSARLTELHANRQLRRDRSA